MASKLIQARKQQLLTDLEEKRHAIQVGAVSLKKPVNVGLNKMRDSQVESKHLMRNATNKPVNVTGILSKASAVAGKASSLMDSPYVNKVIRKVGQKKNRLVVNAQVEGKNSQKLKPVALSCGVAFVVGTLLVQRGKSKKRKKQLEEAKLAKMSAGAMILKWLLATSQPAVKYVITNKVKRGIIG